MRERAEEGPDEGVRWKLGFQKDNHLMIVFKLGSEEASSSWEVIWGSLKSFDANIFLKIHWQLYLKL